MARNAQRFQPIDWVCWRDCRDNMRGNYLFEPSLRSISCLDRYWPIDIFELPTNSKRPNRL